jgi:hypothetical protein
MITTFHYHDAIPQHSEMIRIKSIHAYQGMSGSIPRIGRGMFATIWRKRLPTRGEELYEL